MTAKFWNGGAQVDVVVRKFWNGSSWVDIGLAKFWNGGSWVDITFAGGGGGAGLSATVSAGSVQGTEFRVSPPAWPAVLTVGSDTPSTVTVTPSGGTGPYTYAWTHESGDSAVQVTAPTSATTGFVGNIGKNQTKSAIKRCTVTDSLGATTSVTVSVTLEYIFEF